MVVGNLYPFVETVSAENVTLQDALENIDIGGPTMIRAAAKNFPSVLVLVDPGDYGWVSERVAEHGLPAPYSDTGSEAVFSLDERRELARKAFQHVALYDTAVARYLTGATDSTSWPELTFGYDRVADLRYGENPHQKATLYASALSSGGTVRAEKLHGIDMSYTNYLDADAAWRVVSDFSEPAVAVIKHTNPCGLAVHPDQPTAYQRAFEGDSISAYGGIVGFNRPVTKATAGAMRGVLYDIIVAPGYEEDALKTLRRRRRTRILRIDPEIGPATHLDLRLVTGGRWSRPRTTYRGRFSLEGSHRAQPDRLSSFATSPSPGGRRSTSSPTQSCWRKTARSSAWAPDSRTVLRASTLRCASPATRPGARCWLRTPTSRSQTTSRWLPRAACPR